MPRIALVQQRAGTDRSNNLERALASMRQAAAGGAEIVAFADAIHAEGEPGRSIERCYARATRKSPVAPGRPPGLIL